MFDLLSFWTPGPVELPIILVIVAGLAGLFIPPIRKAMGLLLVIVGAISCLTLFGAIAGIPMIFVGGILLFIKDTEKKAAPETKEGKA